MTGDIRVIDYIRNVAEYIQTTKGQASASQMLDRFLVPARTSIHTAWINFLEENRDVSTY